MCYFFDFTLEIVMAKDRVVLIDGSSLIFRAFFAIPGSFTTREGLHTNAIYGFALMFRKILKGKMPKYGAMIFDAPGKTFRDIKYPEYKSHRPRMHPDLREQLPWIDKLVHAHDFPVIRTPGVEADDVIGTLTKQAIAAGHEVWIISSDKDFAQLIGPDVRMVDTMRDITYDVELVKKKWGVPTHQFVDYLALLGDKADNIPGVPGIGAKGAAQLLEKFSTLQILLESTDQLKGRQQKNLVEFREQALMSQELATIKCDVELEKTIDDLCIVVPDEEKVNAVYLELEFNSLLGNKAAKSGVIDATKFQIVEEKKTLTLLKKVTLTEHSLFPLFDNQTPTSLLGIAVGHADGKAWYFQNSDVAGEALSNYLSSQIPKVIWNERDASTALKHLDINLNHVAFDIQCASFLINPTKIIPHTIDGISKEYLQQNLTPIKALIGSGKSIEFLSSLPTEEVGNWACHLAVAIAMSAPILNKRLNEEGHRKILDSVSMPLSKVLAQMQYVGVRIDPDNLKEAEVEFTKRRDAIKENIHELAGRKFNIASPKQLSVVLFEDLGLPVIKKTKTGYSTNAEVMERLAPQHDIAKLVLRWRALAKLVNTYTKVLREAADPKTHRIHATFQQAAGQSGRLITTQPDLQRTPIRGEDGIRIREAFVPEDGWVFISADWSQIELRVLAHISEDPELIRAFNEDIDLHTQTAAKIYDVNENDVTREQRDVGKTVNFATVYGQGATALGRQLGIPRKEAKAMIEKYFTVYSEVKNWIEETVEDANMTGYVETIIGRRRYIPELKSNNYMDKAYGERVAANTPIQGSAADICKIAMIKIAKAFEDANLQTRMMVQIHDELLFESLPDECEQSLKIIRECMEDPGEDVRLCVPLKVDIGTGGSWAQAH